jgi:2',3'-cyclic-nucleotide 2'-phosphodiesterase (5'-nucleotidase family)
MESTGLNQPAVRRAFRLLLLKGALVVLIGLSGCHQALHISQTKSPLSPLFVNKSMGVDSAMYNQILPYKLKLDSQMNEFIVQNNVELKKELPEGSLGNFFADQLMNYAQTNMGIQPDFCVFNHGGLRLPAIYPGPIYLRTLYELQPFENQLATLQIKGKDLNQVFDLIKEWGGAPTSGIQLIFQTGSMKSATIQGNEIQADKIYTILTSDYLANGGDHADVFKSINEKVFYPTKLRDALILNLKTMAKKGQSIQSKKDGRIQFIQ